MAGYEFPTTPDIESAYRSAFTALAALLPSHAALTEQPDDVAELLSRWPRLVDEAKLFVTGQLGPTVSWTGPPQDGDWDLISAGIDLDNRHNFGEVELDQNAFKGERGTWSGSALDQAGLAYKRAYEGLDFAPGEGGVWLVMLAPTRADAGEHDRWFFHGRLTGFVVVYDHDQDGDYEAVGHIWTAAAWRRRGIARRLRDEAQSRFPITTFDEPYSDDGAAFLDATPPI